MKRSPRVISRKTNSNTWMDSRLRGNNKYHKSCHSHEDGNPPIKIHCYLVKIVLLIANLLLIITAISPSALYGSEKIAFASNRNGNFDLFIMNTDGSNVENILDAQESDTTPSWSPDGSMIAFHRFSLGIFLLDMANRTIKPVTDGAYPTFSPDGKRIAYIAQNPGEAWLCVIDLNGENKRRLKQLGCLSDRPHAWSSDGHQIVCCDKCSDLIIANADDDNPKWRHIVCATPEGIQVPAIDVSWSPRGDKLAIASYADTDTQGIWILNPDGSDLKRLTEEWDFSPEWSPDGRKIAFHSYRAGKADIYVMKSDGSDVTQLTDSPESDKFPSWTKYPYQVRFVGKLAAVWGQVKITEN